MATKKTPPKKLTGDEYWAHAYRTYRKMRAYPAVQQVRQAVLARLRTARWEYSLPAAHLAFVQSVLDPLLPGFLHDAVLVLDYGFAPFEVVYHQDTDHTLVTELKPLLPEYTRPTVDTQGHLVGLVNAGATLDDPRRCLWLFNDNPDEVCSPVGYGRSRLEWMRRTWERHKAGKTMTDLPDLLARCYLNGGDVAATANEVLGLAERALNRLLADLLTLNFGTKVKGTIRLTLGATAGKSDEKNKGPRNPAAWALALKLLAAHDGMSVVEVAQKYSLTPQALYKKPEFQKEWAKIKARRKAGKRVKGDEFAAGRGNLDAVADPDAADPRAYHK